MGSQHPCLEVHNHLHLQLQGLLHTLLGSANTWADVHKPVHSIHLLIVSWGGKVSFL